jgi:hypothetical protein
MFYSRDNYNYLKNRVRLLTSDLRDFDSNYKDFKVDSVILGIKYETEYLNKKFIDKYYPYDTYTKVDTQDWTVDDYRNLNLHTDDTIVVPMNNRIPLRNRIGHFIRHVERDIDDTLPYTLDLETPVYRSFDAVHAKL